MPLLARGGTNTDQSRENWDKASQPSWVTRTVSETPIPTLPGIMMLRAASA
jgi:hypothetical protein